MSKQQVIPEHNTELTMVSILRYIIDAMLGD